MTDTNIEATTQTMGDSAGTATTVPTRDEILDRATALIPLLRAHAEQTEELRRPVDEVIAALDDAGLFQMAIPRRLGGWEAPFDLWVRVAAILAQGCTSTAWVFIQTCQGTSFAFSFDDATQAEMLSAEGRLRVAGAGMPGGTARRVDGGWVVSGEWPYASGIVHATWGLIGLALPDETGDRPALTMGFAPMGTGDDSLTWKDSWHVGGLSGTGSNTIVAEEVFIPDRRLLRLAGIATGDFNSTHPDEVMFRSPLTTLGTMVCVAPMLGAVRAALDFVRDQAPTRRVAYTTYPNQAAAPAVWTALGSAAAKLNIAEHALFGIADQLWTALVEKREIDRVEVSTIRVTSTEISQLCLAAMQELMQAHGSSSFADGNPMQRLFRDVEQASLHGTLLVGHAKEIAGRAILGVD